jgi:chloride channel protein, CIC family
LWSEVNWRTLIPDGRRTELKELARRSHRVVAVAAMVGATTGLLVAALDRLVVDGILDHVLRWPVGWLAALPACGLLLSLAARHWIGGGVSASTSDEYLHAFHDRNHFLHWRPLVARLVAAVATVGGGVPMGLEGPSMYAGATIGVNVQRHFPPIFRGSERRVLLVAGAAAGVAAIFKAPATGAVFALEVPYQDDLARRMLLPALTASASGYAVFAMVNGTTPLFPIDGRVHLAARDLVASVVIGIIAGVGARAFAWMLRRAKDVAATAPVLPTTIVAGAALSGMFALGRLLTGQSLLLGSGYGVVAWAAQPAHAISVMLAILVLRCLATATSVAGGGSGGIFIPLVVGGALIGSMIGGAVDRADLTLFIVIGVAAFLGGGYRVPLAAVMFVAETTGRPSFIVPGLLAAVAAELMMGASSVTRYQVAPPPMPDGDVRP